MYELIYSSSSENFLSEDPCLVPVAWTEGMPGTFISIVDAMMEYIEAAVSYLAEVPDRNAIYLKRKVFLGEKKFCLLIKIFFIGTDHCGKNQILIHHFFFDSHDKEFAASGASFTFMLDDNNFLESWDCKASLLSPFIARHKMLSNNIALQWQSLAGDAGWAGVIAEKFLENSSEPFFVECPDEVPAYIIAELIAEVARLIPHSKHFEFTYNSLFLQEKQNWDCFLRFCPVNSTPIKELKEKKSENFISFIQPAEIKDDLKEKALVLLARKGLMKNERKFPGSPAATIGTVKTFRRIKRKVSTEAGYLRSKLIKMPEKNNSTANMFSLMRFHHWLILLIFVLGGIFLCLLFLVYALHAKTL